MDAEQIARLREAAKKASPGPWFYALPNGEPCHPIGEIVAPDGWSITTELAADENPEPETQERVHADHVYLSMLHPGAVHALLDAWEDRERLRKWLEQGAKDARRDELRHSHPAHIGSLRRLLERALGVLNA